MAAKILVVDDDPNVQRLLSVHPEAGGLRGRHGVRWRRSFRLWGAENPSLILLDVNAPEARRLPGRDQIRQEERRERARPDHHADGRAGGRAEGPRLRAGADDYLIKPFHPAELLARIKSLLARFAPRDSLVGRPPLAGSSRSTGPRAGSVRRRSRSTPRFALHRELGRKVCLVDGNLQFGDHRVFLDLGLDRRSIVDIVSAPSIDQDLVKQVLVKHDSGVDLLLAPPSPETAELVTPEHMPQILDILRGSTTTSSVDIDKRLDDVNLGIIEHAETLFVVMTADLSCLKNVRLVLETIGHLGYEKSKLQLVLNRSNAFTGISVKNAEGALKRTIDHQIVTSTAGRSARSTRAPRSCSRRADSLLGRSLLDFAKIVDKGAPAGAAMPVAAR